MAEMRKYGYEPMTEKTDVTARLHFDALTHRYQKNMSSLSMAIEERVAA